jgi:hypothetical protein
MVRKQADSDEPKLTLQLTNQSFLDTAIQDAFSERTLYIVETRGRDTYVLHISSEGRLQPASQIHWPKKMSLDGPSRIRVQMGSGRWREAEDFLKFGSVFT